MKYLFSLVVFVLVVSCKKKVEVVVEKQPQTESLALFDETSTYNFNQDLADDVETSIKSWEQYFALSKFFKKNFSTISPSLALEMSKELTDLTKSMNDSLQIVELNNRGMYARLHVFYSESLRLQDMSTISSIKVTEITDQVEKLVSVYNSMNLKINSIYLQKSFDENVDFDESIFEFNEKGEAPYTKPKRKRNKRSIYNKKPSPDK